MSRAGNEVEREVAEMADMMKGSLPWEIGLDGVGYGGERRATRARRQSIAAHGRPAGRPMGQALPFLYRIAQ